jgi:hypothetical protein
LPRHDKCPRERGAMTLSQAEFDSFRTAQDVPFRIRKIGHVVLRASNLRKSVELYVRVLGFASEMVGAVRGIDPETGHHYDDTRRYIDSIDWLSETDMIEIFEGNARKVYARLRRP